MLYQPDTSLFLPQSTCSSGSHRTPFAILSTSMYFMFRKRYILLWLVLALLLFIFSTKKYVVSFDGIVRAVKPLPVWEFLMDFNNMKELNPTILDFTIISDGGRGEEWRYDVIYTEFLHQLPFITNVALGKYRFIPISDKEYHIKSFHKTCFFGNFTCMYSDSEFIIRQDKNNPKDTYCLEVVQFECPRILSSFCHNEVMFQRRSIFENLDKYLTQV